MTTNYVKATYQEVFDLGTVSGKVSFLGIHAPDSQSGVYSMLSGFFSQYRKYRYSGCSVAMIPAAQLPADPLQVSYEAGEASVDPRDLLNPILFHGCHGENLNDVLNTIYARTPSGAGINSVSVNRQDLDFDDPIFGAVDAAGQGVTGQQAYYAALSDPSFRKFGIQTGLKLNLRPMVHPVALTHPLIPNNGTSAEEFEGMPGFISHLSEGNILANGTIDGADHSVPSSLYFQTGGKQGVPASVVTQMFTNGLRRLGWIPTAQLPGSSPSDNTSTNPINGVAGYTVLPRIFMGLIILPPSYKQELYFRMVITHFFEFKDFSTSLVLNGESRMSYTNGLPDSVTGVDQTSSIDSIDARVFKATEGVF